jgi:hypothetical protein
MPITPSPTPTPAIAASATTTASKAGGLAGKADVIGAAGQVGALAISTISQISDANKRRKFEENFSRLTLEQQKGLEMMLIESKSATERLSVLAQYLTQLNAQRISNLASYYGEKEKSSRNKTLLILGGVVVAGILVTYILLKNRN